ncbi:MULTISPECIES: ParB/RepB/Spo0J family partition protein [Ehrlichia]|uniref:Probable chromosome-partitioning protein ParB n=1 Tax=Ehrlichia cf. muris str. EmCRT TaxID=1359167 RepID=A0A0F3N5Z7_9RICK|nr:MULTISPECIES: ParB/RepB/Spo0J family partition protein [Ehrlichia]KJV63505.1 parB/RepB/Spo0J family partition domain protein [Ehrlichia cf. muris str. EmCRT]OUC04192.1 chromosome partitioning protein [Ehrlichia sp. Wisconsin_h]
MTKRLGKGIFELIGNNTLEINNNIANISTDTHLTMPINLLNPSTSQPRKTFDQESLRELAESISKHGIIQPIIIRKNPHKKGYEIIAGERRWRASILAKLKSVPVIVKEISDNQCLELSIIENIQRQDLTPIEEAEAYFNLTNTFSYTHEDLASTIGKSRSHITNMIRILSLPPSIKLMINNKLISFGHARALINTEKPEAIAQKIISSNLNVRQTELLIKNLQKPHKNKTQKNLTELEQSLSEILNLQIKINGLKNKGSITIKYNNTQQLNSILDKLKKTT